MRAWFDQFSGVSCEAEEPMPSPAYNFFQIHLPVSSNVLAVGSNCEKLLLPFRNNGHRTYCSERMEFYASSDKFGLICVNHALERVSDPAEMVARLAEMLVDDGLLYISAPNYLRSEYAPQAFHFVSHLSWFTFKSVFRLLMNHGFQVLKKEEGRGIQVLAVKRRGTVDGAERMVSGTESRAGFWDRTSALVIRAFGNGRGDHTLVWFADQSQPHWGYKMRVYNGSRWHATLVKTSIKIERSLPTGLRNIVQGFLPDYVLSGRPRMLTVQIKGDTSLPVTVQYPDHAAAPVWIN